MQGKEAEKSVDMKKTDNCRICRRVGEKLFLKGEKCNSPACPFLKRSYAPGDAGPRSKNRKGSDYLLQLIEKQKARAIYGLNERQMASYFESARKTVGQTGPKLIELLERRLDNAAYRVGFAPSRDEARQMVGHGKILINGKKVNSGSYMVKISDKIASKSPMTKLSSKNSMRWVKVLGPAEAQVIDVPNKDDVSQINEQLIIEYYSR